MKKIFNYYRPHFQIMIYIVVFIVCFGLAILLLTSGSKKRALLPGLDNKSVTTTQENTTGWMNLTAASANAQYAVGEDIVLTVNADSSNVPVTGYDLLFLYDPASISVMSVTSTDPTFDVFTFNNSNFVSVTGTKKLSISSQTAFMNSSILSITVRAKKAGTTPVVIAPQIGPEKTKMVDNKAQIVYPKLGQSLQLNVR